MKLLLATTNYGKARELESLLADLQFEPTSLSDQHVDFVVEETGDSFLENAVKKAVDYSLATGLTTLAEDSGLEVDALGGLPGVVSARFAGASASDFDRNNKILEALENVPWEQRTARFKIVVAIAAPGGEPITAEGVLEGYIAKEQRGEGGFGYDTILYLPERGCTVAELPDYSKNEISHRAKAIRAILPKMQNLGYRLKTGPAQSSPK